MKLLSELVSAISKAEVKGRQDGWIKNVAYDSRQVSPGSLFVCIPGFKTDGHLFAAQAIEKGAVALVMERSLDLPPGITGIIVPDSRSALAQIAAAYYDYPSRFLNLIGVTGTNGKTSTTYLLEAIFSHYGKKTGLLGTITNRVGPTILTASRTTPESLELQCFLATMVNEKTDYAVMEVSSHALSLGRVNETEFDVGVFTNLTQDHLDFHRDFREYRQAKGKLFEDLRPGQKSRQKYAVLNADDPNFDYFKSVSSAPVITYSIETESDFEVTDLKISPRGAAFKIKKFDQQFQMKVTGRFSIYNALAALAVGITEQVPVPVVAEALQRIPGVPGRFELVEAGQGFTVVVDYAHTPDGLKNVLETAKEVCLRKVITVFGCGGDRDRGKRPLMGAVAGRYSDYIFVTSDNPRTEDPEAIIEDIKPGIEETGKGNYRIVINRRQAIRQALETAEAGDLVLIAGKGHETYQIIGTKTYPFDDREVARQYLRGE